MSSIYGKNIHLSIFGQSHGPAIGMTLDGVPAGLPVDMNKLQAFLDRRAPGNNEFSTPRREADQPEFLSGIVNGYTCGAPITAIINNNNTRSVDYDSLQDCPRPGHADFTAHIKFGGYEDLSGGGHFSGRLTAALCIAGGLCLQWLESSNIQIRAHIYSIAGIKDEPEQLCSTFPNLNAIGTDFPVVNKEAGKRMLQAIQNAKDDGDSVGGTVQCFVSGVPAGIGSPIFWGMENRIAQIVFGIPAVKGLEFGEGFSVDHMRGSNNNDTYTVENDVIITKTNHAGGILGGITNGMPIVFRAAIKPTPSIALPQDSVLLHNHTYNSLSIHGRHDPCIVPRAVPVIEAAAAIAIFDTLHD